MVWGPQTGPWSTRTRESGQGNSPVVCEGWRQRKDCPSQISSECCPSETLSETLCVWEVVWDIVHLRPCLRPCPSQTLSKTLSVSDIVWDIMSQTLSVSDVVWDIVHLSHCPSETLPVWGTCRYGVRGQRLWLWHAGVRRRHGLSGILSVWSVKVSVWDILSLRHCPSARLSVGDVVHLRRWSSETLAAWDVDHLRRGQLLISSGQGLGPEAQKAQKKARGEALHAKGSKERWSRKKARQTTCGLKGSKAEPRLPKQRLQKVLHCFLFFVFLWK